MSLSKTKKIYKNYKRKKKYQSKKYKRKKRYQSKNKSKKSKNKKQYKTKKYKRKYRSKILLGGNSAVTDAKLDTNTNTNTNTDPAPEPAPKPQNIISTMFDFFANDDDKKHFEELDEAFNTAKDPIKLFESCLDPDSVNLHPEDKIIKSKYCDSIRHYRDKTIEKLKNELEVGLEQGEDLTEILKKYNIGESDIAAIACDEVLGIVEVSGLCVLIRKILNIENKFPVHPALKDFTRDQIPKDLRNNAINHVSDKLATHFFNIRKIKHLENDAKNSVNVMKNTQQQSSQPLSLHLPENPTDLELAAHKFAIKKLYTTQSHAAAAA